MSAPAFSERRFVLLLSLLTTSYLQRGTRGHPVSHIYGGLAGSRLFPFLDTQIQIYTNFSLYIYFEKSVSFFDIKFS